MSKTVEVVWLTVTPARAQVAAIHEQLRREGIDVSRLPDPVEELRKAREAGYRSN